MSIYYCSLILKEPQVIEPGEENYQTIHFPYEGESKDEWNMHKIPEIPALINWKTDPRSGLIWPVVSGLAYVTKVIYWEKGKYTELRDQFVRDPLGYTDNPKDRTCVEHRPPSLGMQCFNQVYDFLVHINTPVALQVAHNDIVPRKITHAQFKMAIHSDLA